MPYIFREDLRNLGFDYVSEGEGGRIYQIGDTDVWFVEDHFFSHIRATIVARDYQTRPVPMSTILQEISRQAQQAQQAQQAYQVPPEFFGEAVAAAPIQPPQPTGRPRPRPTVYPGITPEPMGHGGQTMGNGRVLPGDGVPANQGHALPMNLDVFFDHKFGHSEGFSKHGESSCIEFTCNGPGFEYRLTLRTTEKGVVADVRTYGVDVRTNEDDD